MSSGCELVADPVELGLDVRARDPGGAVGAAEVEADAGAVAPLERHLVDRARVAGDGRPVVGRRVDVRAGVGRERDDLGRERDATGPVLRAEPPLRRLRRRHAPASRR